MTAKAAAKVEKEIGECSACGSKEVALVGVSSKNGGKVCGECFAKIRQNGLAFDQYDLQPDELTKEMVADKAGVTLRAVEIWKAEGKLAAQKLRRRVNGTVRKQLIFKADDVEEFISGANEPVNMPTIEKTGKQSQALQAPGEMENLFKFTGAMFNELAQKIDATPRLSRFEQLSGKMFLDVEEAARISGLAKSKIEAAIHAAENVDDEPSRLQRFSGDHGRAVWRTADIEKIIETIPPTPIIKRLPPSRKKE